MVKVMMKMIRLLDLKAKVYVQHTTEVSFLGWLQFTMDFERKQQTRQTM